MDYQTYYDLAQEGSKKHEAGDHAGAVRIFEDLVNGDISDLDKAFMSMNVAVIREKTGDVDEALRWYDRGMAFERLYCRLEVAENKAAYFLRLDRKRDALDIYRDLVAKPYAKESEKSRFLNNIDVLESELKK